MNFGALSFAMTYALNPPRMSPLTARRAVEFGGKLWNYAKTLAPGLVLCLGVTGVALTLQAVETRLLGKAWLEALVLAIVLGAAVRTVWPMGARWRPGVTFSGKILLEIAVVLLGAGISADALRAAGPLLLAGIAGLVFVTIAISYGLGRLLGLPRRMAALIACGNAICGNSAIAAVAPVINAEGKDVAAAIGFTAVLGVGVVLGLPMMSGALHMTPRAYGVLAGLTVYAVPQVLAATAPISTLSAQIGALVKLIRVLMLGPVVLALAFITRRSTRSPTDGTHKRLKATELAPWFIIGFLLMMTARWVGVVPAQSVAPLSKLAAWLTIVSMAALGLGVDVRVVGKAGPRAIAVVTLSLTVLGVLALGLIALLGVR